ncbi:alpha/beta hydrolase [Microbacterium sp. NPDC019599]|uniref:alpha/beta hydrolase n=1 Tax=Microbacterium sp. NPDC019599 TaxID=3154690 RepID=UPI0033CC5344
MTDVYWERVAAVAAALQAAAANGEDQGGDHELVARLTLPQSAEAGYLKPAADVREATVPSPAQPVPVRIYRPHGDVPGDGAARPLLIWCHGGAFLGGDLDMPEADAVAREIVNRSAAVVISVDYRLCLGGVHFPAPSDDLVAVFEWAVRHAATLGVDPSRIVIGGASAGACLTAGVALRLSAAGATQPAAVVLAYPVVHAVLPAASYELATKLADLPAAMAFTPEVIEPVMENYLGAPAADATAYAIAGVSDSAALAALPPTLIINCEYDGLRASGERYADQLREAGVEVDVQLARDVAHGHLNRPGLPEAQRTLATIAMWVAERCVAEHAGA